MLKVIYWERGTRYADEIESLNEVYSYEESCLNGILYYDFTIDENNIIVHADDTSDYSVGDKYELN